MSPLGKILLESSKIAGRQHNIFNQHFVNQSQNLHKFNPKRGKSKMKLDQYGISPKSIAVHLELSELVPGFKNKKQEKSIKVTNNQSLNDYFLRGHGMQDVQTSKYY